MKSPHYKPGCAHASNQPKPYQKQHDLTDDDTQKCMMTNNSDDQLTVLNLNFKEPFMAEVQRHTFLNLHPEAINISVMHRDCHSIEKDFPLAGQDSFRLWSDRCIVY